MLNPLGLLLLQLVCQHLVSSNALSLFKSVDIDDTPTQAPASSNLPEGYVRFPDLHVAYKLYAEPIDWVDARDRCIAEGAQLAIADTVEKIERIRSMPPEAYDWISVGIQKSDTTGQWLRIDNNLPLEYLPWMRRNPNDEGNCVAISMIEYALFNCPCNLFPNWYACEIPI